MPICGARKGAGGGSVNPLARGEARRVSAVTEAASTLLLDFEKDG
jgi:hypothetical protein